MVTEFTLSPEIARIGWEIHQRIGDMEFETEDEWLAYEQRVADNILYRNLADRLCDESKMRVYRDFLNSSSDVSPQIGRDSGIKLDLLLEHFPGRFGSEGKQPLVDKYGFRLEHLTPERVDTIYTNILRYAKKRCDNSKQ